jgi:SAM-dependent methyltransferase
MSNQDQADIRIFVREHYGAIAEKTGTQDQTGCCGPTSDPCCGPGDDVDQFSMVSALYQDPDLSSLPVEVTEISLGCGDPVTLASLEPGQTVLDLGSGGGIDCFLAARKVGPTGHVIGVDMTPTMIEKARSNQQKIGATNVEFRLGEIEHLPVADGTVDVILSNCVINLSPDKPQVFQEAYRVLVPGGKLAVSDIVTDGPLPAAIKSSLSAWAGCVAGALDVQDYVRAIEDAGFIEVHVTPVYWSPEMVEAAFESLDPDIRDQVLAAKESGQTPLVVNEGMGGDVIRVAESEMEKSFDPQKAVFSAKITARKPK